ncbi:MAG: alkaline phosphatase family protein [Steroidobacteraceae bacterium]
MSLTGFRLSSVCGLLATLALSWQSVKAATVPAPATPRIGHVFILMLENEGYHVTFGPRSPAKYLNHLKRQGALVRNYFGTSHFSLGNYIALISGQAPNPATEYDCRQFTEFVATGVTPDGQAIGTGCVYPASVPTITNQLDTKGLTWKAYMEDMGNNPERESATCGHPQIGAPDNTQAAQSGDQYASRHDPFVYFHGIIDTPSCAQHVVNIRALNPDLKLIVTTPNYVFITPNLCHDGHDGGEGGRCVNGEPGGLVSADEFLKTVVPQIVSSPAFRRNGLLIITFDESELEYDYDASTQAVSVSGGDAAACCNEPSGPNIPAYQTDAGIARTAINGPGLTGPGGGRIGAIMLSPFIKPGTVSPVPYNHYSLLKSVEDIFGVSHLGYAGQAGLKGFGPDIFTQPHGRSQ